MTSPSTIAASHFARLSGWSERHLRRLADEGWFPRPVRNQYPLLEAIAGLLRHYRDQHDHPTVRDVYPNLPVHEVAGRDGQPTPLGVKAGCFPVLLTPADG